MAGRHARKRVQRPRKTGYKTFRPVVPMFIAGLVGLGAGGYYWLNNPLTHHTRYPTYPAPAATHIQQHTVERPVPSRPSRLTVLLIGTDTRPGQAGGNTDVLMLASLDPSRHRIELLSIPRDTRVTYPNGSKAKINEALSLGGPALAESLVANLTGQTIEHYALTHFGGLVDIIDTIGGITVDVPERMYYNTGDTKYNLINLKPGVQNLSGAQSLGFVRYRHDTLGDIGRTVRQQQFLKALENKLLEPQNMTQLPTLIGQFWNTIDSDMNMLDVVALAANAKTYSEYKVISETLPGSFHNPNPNVKNDQSYWIVNPKEAKYTTERLFENGVVQTNPVQDQAETDHWTPPVEANDNLMKGRSNVSKENDMTLQSESELHSDATLQSE